MVVPLTDSTRIFTPTAGSFTPWFGSSAYQYLPVSSNSGCASWPRMCCSLELWCSWKVSAFFKPNGAS